MGCRISLEMTTTLVGPYGDESMDDKDVVGVQGGPPPPAGADKRAKSMGVQVVDEVALILYRGLGPSLDAPPALRFRDHMDLDKKVFTCYSGTKTVPLSFLNDNYCDCDDDGSDEPGTSACSHGHFICGQLPSITTTLPPYHHLRGQNKQQEDGEVAASIPSSRVNDGFCDW